MKLIVTKDSFKACIEEIQTHTVISFDCETTGLEPYKGDRLFMLGISTFKDDFVFNFRDTPDHLGNKDPEETILERSKLKDILRLFSNRDNTIFIHNAKFDMHMLNVENYNFRPNARIICTQALSRLVHNILPSYSLANLGSLIGWEKDDTVDKYISKHKLYTDVDVGKKNPKRYKHFDLLPFDKLTHYQAIDSRIHYELGSYIHTRLVEINEEQLKEGLIGNEKLIENEIRLTKTLFKAEARGVKIDRAYCEEAYEYEKEMYLEAMNKFYALTEIEFEDAAKCYKKAFNKLGLEGGKTEKGNDSYSVDNLPECELTEIILQYRKHYKRATTYFKNFLDLADDNDIIHCSFNQGGTATGRLSASEPNLQNVPKRGDDKNKYPIRKAFIPRKGYKFVMKDFDQMEYRKLLDVANEVETIKLINEDGLDVHTATANMMGVERDSAKTLNFMLLYGGGAAKLAAALLVSISEAKSMKRLYFSTLKKVQMLVKAIIKTSEVRGYIVNWLGRRLLTPKGLSYKMPNYYIQGGCGDVAKVAMNKIDDYLENNKDLDIHMLLTVHDENIFEYPIDAPLCTTEKIKDIMENAYPYKSLKLTAGVEHSITDWHNKGVWNEKD